MQPTGRSHSNKLTSLVCLTAVLMTTLVVAPACGEPKALRIRDIVPTKGQESVWALAKAHPGQFGGRYTLLIAVDETATCGLDETIFWDDWEDAMHERGFGFVLATSSEDSMDLVVVAQMDSVKAMPLVLPSCKHYLAELEIRPGYNPLNMLLDSSATVRFVWAPVGDSAGSRQIIRTIDSLVASWSMKQP